MESLIKYQPEVCTCCGQTTTYLLGIDRGTVDILKAISVAIQRKGINIIHPRKEMEVHGNVDYQTMVSVGMLTSNHVGNLSRPRFHGLIARVRGEPGNYCMTTKGAQFLHDVDVPRFAIVSKAEGHQIGYYRPDEYRVTIKDFRPDHEYWLGINYQIVDGRIVKDPVLSPQSTDNQHSLFN